MKRLAQKTLDALPTVRLYYGDDLYFKVPYVNADTPVDVPLALEDFTAKGRGIAFACGISNAILKHKDLFDHDVFLANTIGSATYIVCAVNKGGQPRLAVRLNHSAGPMIEAYDKSKTNPKKYRPIFMKLLEEHPYLHLRKGRCKAGQRGSGTPAHVNGHEKNRQNLAGNARRMANAGFIPPVLAEQAEHTMRASKVKKA